MKSDTLRKILKEDRDNQGPPIPSLSRRRTNRPLLRFTCVWCKKPISDDDELSYNAKGEPLHYDCKLEERAAWELPNLSPVPEDL